MRNFDDSPCPVSLEIDICKKQQRIEVLEQQNEAVKKDMERVQEEKNAAKEEDAEKTIRLRQIQTRLDTVYQ